MRNPTPAALLVLLTACGPPALPPLETGPVAVSVHLDDKKIPSGEAVAVTLRVATAEGWTVASPQVAVEGLTVAAPLPPDTTLDGHRTVRTQRVELQGPDGSYVLDLPPVMASGPDGETQTLDAPAVFFDLGTQGPASSLTEFETTPPPAASSARWIALAALAAACLGAAAFLLARRRKDEAAAPLSAEEEARQRWAAAQAKAAAGDLDDAGLALALSTVFRAWLEATQAFPARARTTSEILAFLDHNGLLLGDDRTRSRRLLTATDRLKFAREGGGRDFFAALDADLEAVLSAREASLLAEQQVDAAPGEEVAGE